MSNDTELRSEHSASKSEAAAHVSILKKPEPRKSVVQVYFPSRNRAFAYYNDRFELNPGDFVFVDGKLEGERGRVTEVSYNFKIKISDYKRVIAVADTAVRGRFYMLGSHLVTFDHMVLPPCKIRTWFKPPVSDEDEYASGSDDTTFKLSKLEDMKLTPAVVERGHDYFTYNRVRYICLDGAKGYAIVDGSKPYELEFEYHDGEISKLHCSCFCSYNCKHELAAMLQLKDILELIEKHYPDEYERSNYFAAVYNATLFDFTVDDRESGSLTLRTYAGNAEHHPAAEKHTAPEAPDDV